MKQGSEQLIPKRGKIFGVRVREVETFPGANILEILKSKSEIFASDAY